MRDTLKAYLEQVGVSTVIHYPIAPHRQACYATRDFGQLPVAEQLANEVLSLPMFPDLSSDEMSHVVSSVWGFNGGR